MAKSEKKLKLPTLGFQFEVYQKILFEKNQKFPDLRTIQKEFPSYV